MLREIKVFDLEGQERDFLYAQTKYGVAFRRAEVEPGQKVYRLIELREKTGHHSLVTKVLNEAGYPIEHKGVAFTWPDAPDPPDPPTIVDDRDWYPNFVHGPTNANGDVGPAMGKGAYHGEGEGGPHAVWVRDENIPSDICERLGMLAGTFHDHLDQVFQLEIEGGTPVPREGKFVEAEGSRTVEVLPPEGVRENHISIKCEGAPNFYDTRVDLRVTIGHDDWENANWTDPNPHYPAGLHHYNTGAIYTPEPGETARSFWVLIRHAGTEELLSDPLRFRFNTGEGRKYAVRVEWRTGDEPTPPTPPSPPSDLADLFREAAGLHHALGRVWDDAANILGAAKDIL